MWRLLVASRTLRAMPQVEQDLYRRTEVHSRGIKVPPAPLTTLVLTTALHLHTQMGFPVAGLGGIARYTLAWA